MVPGCGIGLHMVRAIDPELSEIATEELADGPERTRERRPWEPGARWLVAARATVALRGRRRARARGLRCPPAADGSGGDDPRGAARARPPPARVRAAAAGHRGAAAARRRVRRARAGTSSRCHGEAAGSVRRLARERIADVLAAPWLESPERAAG
ncbi:MAG: hypothetical protein U0168_24845 [Nannocystaceae bacterium]